MMSTVPVLRPYRPDDLVAATRTLTRAFADDPGFAYLFPDRAKRPAQMSWLLERWLLANATRGTAMVSGDVSAVAIWFRPGERSEVSVWRQLRLGLAKAPFTLGWLSFRRLLRVDGDTKSRHERELATPAFVLDIIGVDPAAQGRKLGAALMTSMLAQADAASAPAYLITHNAPNTLFYRRFGYGVINEAPIAADGPTGWSMTRPGR